MKRRTIRVLGTAGAVTAVVGLAAAAYPLALRRRCLQWGARPEEAVREIPGEDEMPHPDLLSTRAITIDAPPEAIWPWLVQMGSGRGGAYTYDWVENLLGLDMHSVDEILPEFQNLKVGDELPLGDGSRTMRVEILRTDELLAFRSTDGQWLWSFALYPDGDSTRLVSRNLITVPDASFGRRFVNMFVMEPGSLLMERKMLLGIKARAERAARIGALAALPPQFRDVGTPPPRAAGPAVLSPSDNGAAVRT